MKSSYVSATVEYTPAHDKFMRFIQRANRRKEQALRNKNRHVVMRRGKKFVYYKPYKPTLLPIIRKLYPTIIAKEIMGDHVVAQELMDDMNKKISAVMGIPRRLMR